MELLIERLQINLAEAEDIRDRTDDVDNDLEYGKAQGLVTGLQTALSMATARHNEKEKEEGGFWP